MDSKLIDEFLDIIDMIEYLESKKEQSKNEVVKQELNRKIKYLEQQLKDMNDSQIPNQKQETQESNREKEILDSIDSNFSETTSAFDKNQSSDNATDDTTNRQIDVNDIDIVTKPQYDKIGDFQNGLAKVKLNGKWGFIDKDGNLAIEVIYDEVDDFNYQGFAKIKLNNKAGYINRNGKVTIEPIFDEIGNFDEYDFIQVKLDGKWGFIDKNSNFYDEVGEFFNGLAKIKLNDKWGFVNASGDVIIELIYDEAGDFNYQGLAKVKLDGKWGFIDKNGKFYNERPIINF